MPDEFKGDPTPLRDADFAKAARQLGCSVAAVRAVALVESAGAGFLPDGRPKLLFERHVFHARTSGRFSAANPDISSSKRGGYLGGTREYDRLRAAILLDRGTALQSASWGKFQVMGFNFAACGHPDVESFVAAMVLGEPAQLAAFVAFIQAKRLDGALIRHDWASFAQGYNGSAYAENAYDRKMADAYALFTGLGASIPILRLGATGQDVFRLQERLGQRPDGNFGPSTQAAVRAFQQTNGLFVDGVVGRDTRRALLG
jgi:peptidoglycan hydrolase-like protein with peptidoglycan-binding domain